MTDLATARARLRCNVAQIDDVFPQCLAQAERLLDADGIEAWLDGASELSALGRGQDLPLLFLQHVPLVAGRVGSPVIADIVAVVRGFSDATVPKAIAPFLSTLPACARRLDALELLRDYFALLAWLRDTAPDALHPLLQNVDALLGQISVAALRRWCEYGLRSYRDQPHRLPDYFGLQTADSRAALARERDGTLYADVERALDMTLRALWNLDVELVPYSNAWDTLRRPQPHLDKLGFHIPDVYEDQGGVSGLDRYRAALAHLAAHQRWSRPYLADNYNRFQQLVIETFEDARVERLAIRDYPGLRRLWLGLHPHPKPDACPPGHSCIRHKLAMLSRALLDPEHGYTDPVLLEYVRHFEDQFARAPEDAQWPCSLGVEYLLAIHTPDFRKPKVWFEDTEVSYRDDNRYLWIFLEDTTDEEDFHSDHSAPDRQDGDDTNQQGGFARHHPEWDLEAGQYRPDWTTVYERLPETGPAADINAILDRHRRLANRLRQLVDALKPQHHQRQRFQEDGDELDLDIALRAVIDQRSGTTPDPRIHWRHQHAGRDIAVLLLLDLSESVNGRPIDCEHTVLQLAREAVTLLAHAVDALGDPFAIAGFASNTRFDVRYQPIKGFGERWGDEVKSRLAALSGGLSTRMGAALRHAGHYLSRRPEQKKLLLLLTDGEPADIDVDHPTYLHADAHKAVEELETKGITPWCLTLDPRADTYVADIFGPHRYTVLDRVETLPERLPKLFMTLTR